MALSARTIREKRRDHISSEIERTTDGVSLALLEYEDSVLRWVDNQSPSNTQAMETAKAVLLMYKDLQEFRKYRRENMR